MDESSRSFPKTEVEFEGKCMSFPNRIYIDFFFFLEYCKVNSQPRLFVAKILFAKSKPAGLLRCVNLIANCCHRKVKKKQLENAKEEYIRQDHYIGSIWSDEIMKFNNKTFFTFKSTFSSARWSKNRSLYYRWILWKSTKCCFPYTSYYNLFKWKIFRKR